MSNSNQETTDDVAVIVRLAELLVVMCVLVQINPIQAQGVATGTAASVTVGSMAAAVDVLVSRYGYVVTLETPRYVCADDLEDEPAQFQKGTPRRILMARGNSLTLSLPPAASMGTAEMSSLVKQIAKNASKSDHGAHFRVKQDGDVFHIIPSEIRDAKGRWGPRIPFFDTRISIPMNARSLLETVNAVCSALEAAAHVHVGLLQAPLNTLRYSSNTIAASNESARSVLTRALSTSRTKLTWRVFYDVPMDSYLLSVFVVPENPSVRDQKW